jgi:tetratricopeptide (TPR) repeat protein/ferredoxin
MVVDPGCMKCLDCVSVCPNDALSFKIAKPALFASARTPEAKERRAEHRVPYDLTMAEEVWVGLVFLVFTWFGFRGMLNSVPLLMSAGLGAIAAFTTWKLVRVVGTPSVRLGHLQLRIKGRYTRWGVAFVPLALGLFVLGVWGTVVRGSREVGGYWDYHVMAADAFAPGYVPEPHEKAKADAAISNLVRGDSSEFGGIGWSLKTGDVSRLAWLYAVAGDKDACVRMQERVVALIRTDVNATSLKDTKAERNASLADAVLRLADFRLYRGDSAQQVEAYLKENATGEEGLGAVHLRVAFNTFQRTRDAGEAEKLVREGAALDRRVREHADTVMQGTRVLEAIGRGAMGRGLFTDEIEHSKWAPHVRVAFGRYLASSGQVESAKEQFALASEDRIEAEQAWLGQAQVLVTQKRVADAIKVLEPAITKRPRSTALVSLYARALQSEGRTADAAKQLRRWSELDPRDQTPWISLAALERGQGGDKAALAVLLEGERHRNDDPIMLVVVGEELLKAKRVPEAMERFVRAVELPPRNPEVRAHAKGLLTKAGLAKEAEAL